MAETETAKPPERQQTTLSRWTPSLPTNVIAMLNPFGDDNTDKTNGETNASPNNRLSFLSAILNNDRPSSPPDAELPSPSKDRDSMFAEPDTRSNSDGSPEGSVADGLEQHRSKKSDKPKTRYTICHPPPASTTRQRLHRRPRSLLQLHKQSSNARPEPAYEVIPSANFSVKLTKTITKVFKAKHGLCPNDLVVLKAEKYSAGEPNEEQEARDVIALICKGRKEDGGATGKARICFPDGREWEAYPTLNGGYEFFRIDEHGLGLTVRWVLKKNKDGSKPISDSEKRKFNFSTISPNSRRHPVIATLCKTKFEICNSYKVPEPSAATPLSTPRRSSKVSTGMTEEEQSVGKDIYETDDHLRQIIVMTGIWVAFKEGWSPNFKYDDKDSSLQRSPSLRSPSKTGTFSTLSTPPGTPNPASPGLEKRNSFTSIGSGMFRKGSLLGKPGTRTSTASVPEAAITAQSLEGSKKTGRTRADSASTVLVHRAASNRVRNQLHTWRPDSVTETQEPPSSEDRPHTPDVQPPLTPTPQRRQPVAQPALPSANDGSEDRAVNGSRRPSVRSKPETQTRGSSRTTTNTSAASDAVRKPSLPVSSKPLKKKKKSGWRRLLCGGGQDV